MSKLLAFVFMSVLFSCTDEERTQEVLEAQGYTDVEILGYGWGRCSEGDNTCTTFVATGPATLDERGRWHSGKRVRGAVGCGRTGCGKSCTVRITSVER